MAGKAEKNTALRLVTRSGLAEVFGVALPTVDGWVRQGCPVVKRGSRGVEWTFDTADVAKWRENRAAEAASGNVMADEAELKRRRLAAETALSELDLAKAKGQVAPVREFERAQAALNAAIRQNCLNIPQRVVVQLLGCTDENEFKAKLRAEIVLALETAASADLAIDDDEDGSDAD